MELIQCKQSMSLDAAIAAVSSLSRWSLNPAAFPPKIPSIHQWLSFSSRWRPVSSRCFCLLLEIFQQLSFLSLYVQIIWRSDIFNWIALFYIGLKESIVCFDFCSANTFLNAGRLLNRNRVKQQCAVTSLQCAKPLKVFNTLCDR